MIEKYFCSSTFRFAMASFIAAVMLLFRYYKVGRDTYTFLLWNLFLAWVPYILVLVLAFVLSYPSKSKRYLPYMPFLKRFVLWPLLALSLFFFLPNSFYIFTDLIHLISNGQSWYDNFQEPNALVWFDLIFFLHCSVLGLFLGCHTLLAIDCMMMQKQLRRWHREALIFGLLFLSSYGVIIGRFERLNSWDILLNPDILMQKAVTVLLHIKLNLQFSLIYTLFLSFSYLYMRTNLQFMKNHFFYK